MGTRQSARKHLNGAKSRKRVIRIGERDGWRCQLCKGSVTPITRKTKTGTSNPHRASVDHIDPIANGGSEIDANLRLAHQSCNSYINGDKSTPYQPFDRTPYLVKNESTD